MKLVVNETEYIYDFIRLNEEWISAYFELEDADYELRANPYGIIENGGYIFCLVCKNNVLGTCALFNEGKGVFELARMAVSPNYQRKGFGQMLIDACVSKLINIGASKVFIVSNTKLKAAISLYKKNGFTTIYEGPHPKYSRANIIMEQYL